MDEEHEDYEYGADLVVSKSEKAGLFREHRHKRKHRHDEGSRRHHYRDKEHKRKRHESDNKNVNSTHRKYETADSNETYDDPQSHRPKDESKQLSDILVQDFDAESAAPIENVYSPAVSDEMPSESEEEQDESKPKGIDNNLPPYFPAVEGCRSLNEFECLNRIGEGTFGVVYRFRDKRSGEIVALKKLKMEKEKEGFPHTSLREINTLLKAQHPNIVTVREIVMGSHMDKIFIVMDYVEHDLKTLMESMRAKEQRFMPAEVKCLLRQLLLAVAHLHDNWILHRDLKTSNLLLSHKGILKVGDFGSAREYGSPLKSYTSLVVTLWYRAPELLLGCERYSTPLDMWSIGCIFGEWCLMSAILPGKSEIEQINRIYKFLGTPNEKIWPGYNSLPAVKKIKFPTNQPSNLRKKFQILTDVGLNLLLQFLTYDPGQRITAEAALKHPYFKEYPTAIDPSLFPQWPAKSEGLKRVRSPKAPEHVGLTEDDGFRIGIETSITRSGAGFSLKF